MAEVETPVTPTGPAEATDKGIRITSTTDTQEQVDSAMGKTPPETPQETPPETPPPPSDQPPAETSAPASDEVTTPEVLSAEEQEDLSYSARVKKRIKILSTRNYEKDARIATLEQELAATAPPPVPDETPTVPQRPRTEDFTSTEDYIEAVSTWKAEEIVSERLAARDTKAREDQTQRQQTTAQDAWTEQITATRARHADYDEVVGACAEPTSTEFGNILTQLDRGSELLYALAKLPGETTRINALSPIRIVQELTKLETTLPAVQAEDDLEVVPAVPVEATPISTTPTVPASLTPAAPIITTPAAPLAPLTPSADEVPIPLEQMDYKDYRKARDKGRIA